MATIRLRRDTAANWAAINPVLALAEPGWDTTAKQLRIGDGVTPWSSLPPYSGPGTDGGSTGTGVGLNVWSGTTWPTRSFGADPQGWVSTNDPSAPVPPTMQDFDWWIRHPDALETL